MAGMNPNAATLVPDFSFRQRIVADDLRRLQEPCVVFEHFQRDSDGEPCYWYTVGGWLDGKPIGGMDGGATVGGDAIVVHAANREDADAIAHFGLLDTISALHSEERIYQEANAALARLSAVGPVRRMELATAAPADKSDAFVEDAKAVERLRGDDLVLTVGTTAPH